LGKYALLTSKEVGDVLLLPTPRLPTDHLQLRAARPLPLVFAMHQTLYLRRVHADASVRETRRPERGRNETN
jgi:hypothetical protein